MEENKTWQVIITHQVADDQDKTGSGFTGLFHLAFQAAALKIHFRTGTRSGEF